MALDMDALVLVPIYAALGEALEYGPPDSADYVAFTGIWGEEQIAPDEGPDASGAITPFRALCKARVAAFPDPVGPKQGGAVRRGGDEYVITDTRPDGRGQIFMALARG